MKKPSFWKINDKFNGKISEILDNMQSSQNLDDDDIEASRPIKPIMVGREDTRIISPNGEENTTVKENYKIPGDIDSLARLVDAKKEFNSGATELIQTLLRSGMTVAAILLILSYEKENVITTKAFGFIPKP